MKRSDKLYQRNIYNACDTKADIFEAGKTAQLDSDLKEHKELEQRLKLTYCAYCGMEFTIDNDDTPRLVSEHIMTCPKHPIQQLRKEHKEQVKQAIDAAIIAYESTCEALMKEKVREIFDEIEQLNESAWIFTKADGSDSYPSKLDINWAKRRGE